MVFDRHESSNLFPAHLKLHHYLYQIDENVVFISFGSADATQCSAMLLDQFMSLAE